MNKKFIEHLNSVLSEWTIEYRVHATRRMFERNIDEANFLFLLQNSRALHAVVAVDSITRRLYLITIDEPEPEKWTDNFSRRIKQ